MRMQHEDVDADLYDGTAQPPQKVGGLYVRFHLEPVLHKLKSYGGTRVRPDGTEETVEGAGRPIYEDMEFVEISVPGDKTSVVDRPVRPEDKRQYAEQYKAFKAGNEEQLTGTPLSQWPVCSRAQVKELEFFHIRTVEQLAEVSDGNLQQVGPIRALRDRARGWLEAAKGNAHNETLRSQLAERDNRIDALSKEVAQLKDILKGSAKKQ